MIYVVGCVICLALAMKLSLDLSFGAMALCVFGAIGFVFAYIERICMDKYDIDEMIKETEKVRKDDEVICYAIGAGAVFSYSPRKMKKIKKALDFIKGLDGFLGIHPEDRWHTTIVFDSLNNAKGAKNMMEAKGIKTGYGIAPILVKKEYVR